MLHYICKLLREVTTIGKHYIMTKDEQILTEYLNDYGLDIFSRDQITEIENLSYQQIEIALRGLTRRLYIKIIDRGKYCKQDFSDEFVIGSFIVKNGGVAYWSAMNFHGLTEQIPNVIFVQTSQRKKDKSIFGVRYKFIKVKENKLIGYKTEWYENLEFNITDVEKTIVDCFDLPKYSGGYPEIVKAFNIAELSAIKLVKYCKSMNNLSIVKRLAYLTELLNKPKMDYFLNYALSIMNKKYNLFEHDGEKTGRTNRRWRLVLNINDDEIMNMAKS